MSDYTIDSDEALKAIYSLERTKLQRTLLNVASREGAKTVTALNSVSTLVSKYIFKETNVGTFIFYNSITPPSPAGETKCLDDLNRLLDKRIREYKLSLVAKFVRIKPFHFDFELTDVSLMDRDDELVDVMTI